MKKLRKGTRVVLLPSGEETRVRSVGQVSFSVAGHVLSLSLNNEYDPVKNPSGSWCRIEGKEGWNTGP